jgi:membrane fusion protein (multidrug efflux system)
MTKRILAGSALLSLILVLAAVVLFAQTKTTTSMEQVPGQRATDIRIMEVRVGPLVESIELPASVEPFMTNEVSAEVEGRIDWIGPKEGDMIAEAGTPLLRIDQRLFKAQLDEAQAAHDLSSKKCQRAEELHADGVFSDEQLDQCRTQVATDAARLEIALVQLEKATVRAPIAGILNKSYFEVGEYVRTGEKVASIVVIDPVKVLVKAPEKDIPHLKLGDKVGVVLSLLDNKRLEGNISYISVVGDPATRTYNVEITVPNPKRQVLPSMIASVVFMKRQIPDAITVPLVSVLPRGDFAAVFVENDGIARERPVELGILEGSRVQILKGLEAGDRLVIEGQRRLSDGDPVKVFESSKAR